MHLSPCCRCSAKQNSSCLNPEKALRRAWTSSHPEILVILGFDLAASVLASFSAFSHWVSACSVPLWKTSVWKCYLSDQCHGFCIVELVVVSEVFPLCTHLHITDMSIQQYWDGVGLTNSAGSLARACKGHT